MHALHSGIDSTAKSGRTGEDHSRGRDEVQDSAEKAKALLGLLEGLLDPNSVDSRSSLDDNGTDDYGNDEDEDDYMEDDGTFTITVEDQEPAHLMRFGGSVEILPVGKALLHDSDVESEPETFVYEPVEYPDTSSTRFHSRRTARFAPRLEPAGVGYASCPVVAGRAVRRSSLASYLRAISASIEQDRIVTDVGAHLVETKAEDKKEDLPQRRQSKSGSESILGEGGEYLIRTSPTARDRRPVEAPPPLRAWVPAARPGTGASKRGFLRRVRESALRIARRAVRYLEIEDLSGDDKTVDALAHGKKSNRAPVARNREMPAHSSPPETGLQFAPFMVLPPGNLPPPQAKLARAPEPRQPRPPGEFESLLRTKIFKPAVQLATPFPEPPWGAPPPPALGSLFPKPPGVTLVSQTLTPLGKFVADRDRAVRETLKDVELGLGASAGGIGVDFSTKGVFGLLKPVQWINTWRSLPREVHVDSCLLKPDPFPGNPPAIPVHSPANKPGDLEIHRSSLPDPPIPGDNANPNIKNNEELLHRLLHQVDHELMSSLKYQFGESEYITVITFSEASRGDRVNSGAIALFKASSFVSGRHGVQATKVDLEARFQDVPGAICRILATEGDPNRFELRRNGKKLSVKTRGAVAPPRPGIVQMVTEDWKGKARDSPQEGKSSREGIGKEWVGVGSGWRRALHILLDHPGQDRGGEDDEGEEEDCPRDGLIATIPQMLALLHLRYRMVDCAPSSQVFAFRSPLECNKLGDTGSGAGGGPSGTWYVRRGVKLFGPPIGATHVGSTGTVAVLFSRESRWVREQLFWA